MEARSNVEWEGSIVEVRGHGRMGRAGGAPLSTRSRPIELLIRTGRSSIRLMLSSGQRRAIEQVESNESEGLVDSGRKTPCNHKLARWGGGGGVLAC
jgi:hypothetical protein